MPSLSTLTAVVCAAVALALPVAAAAPGSLLWRRNTTNRDSSIGAAFFATETSVVAWQGRVEATAVDAITGVMKWQRFNTGGLEMCRGGTLMVVDSTMVLARTGAVVAEFPEVEVVSCSETVFVGQHSSTLAYVAVSLARTPSGSFRPSPLVELPVKITSNINYDWVVTSPVSSLIVIGWTSVFGNHNAHGLQMSCYNGTTGRLLYTTPPLRFRYARAKLFTADGAHLVVTPLTMLSPGAEYSTVVLDVATGALWNTPFRSNSTPQELPSSAGALVFPLAKRAGANTVYSLAGYDIRRRAVIWTSEEATVAGDGTSDFFVAVSSDVAVISHSDSAVASASFRLASPYHALATATLPTNHFPDGLTVVRPSRFVVVDGGGTVHVYDMATLRLLFAATPPSVVSFVGANHDVAVLLNGPDNAIFGLGM